MATCEACGTKLPTQKAGRPRKYCPPVDGVHQCRELAEAITKLEAKLGPVVARLVDTGTSRSNLDLVELRYRLFTLLADEVPRPRYEAGTLDADGNHLGGRFIKRRA